MTGWWAPRRLSQRCRRPSAWQYLRRRDGGRATRVTLGPIQDSVRGPAKLGGLRFAGIPCSFDPAAVHPDRESAIRELRLDIDAT